MKKQTKTRLRMSFIYLALLLLCAAVLTLIPPAKAATTNGINALYTIAYTGDYIHLTRDIPESTDLTGDPVKTGGYFRYCEGNYHDEQITGQVLDGNGAKIAYADTTRYNGLVALNVAQMRADGILDPTKDYSFCYFNGKRHWGNTLLINGEEVKNDHVDENYEYAFDYDALGGTMYGDKVNIASDVPTANVFTVPVSGDYWFNADGTTLSRKCKNLGLERGGDRLMNYNVTILVVLPNVQVKHGEYTDTTLMLTAIVDIEMPYKPAANKNKYLSIMTESVDIYISDDWATLFEFKGQNYNSISLSVYGNGYAYPLTCEEVKGDNGYQHVFNKLTRLERGVELPEGWNDPNSDNYIPSTSGGLISEPIVVDQPDNVLAWTENLLNGELDKNSWWQNVLVVVFLVGVMLMITFVIILIVKVVKAIRK